ncbi:MAG: hypothetical protein JO356_20515 [Acidobacteria bacterium]|nr:hypothetical protein [Acidobacteriota bacterium]
MTFFALELCLTAICIGVACTYPQLGDVWFSRLEQRFSRLAQRKRAAVIITGLLALAIRLAVLPILPVPQPKVEDEFSHLLLADTLAQGRLANPTHPMWVHFETFHVNWQPTYASMYYPGHGLFLAFGQVVLGHPFWGVWLSSGLMCAAVCWALQGWMPAGWALVGGLLVVIRVGAFSYWADSYWGGTVPALGGALVLGAFPRIASSQRLRDTLLMALGMAIVASTRPYEGIFFCTPTVLFLLWQFARKSSRSLPRFLLRQAVPGTLLLALALIGLGYYFWRVTGSPFTTPYQVNMRAYGLIFFPWQHIKVGITFHHPEMRMFYTGGAVVGCYHLAREHSLELQSLKALVIWLFYFGPALSLPILAWLCTRPRGQFWKSFTPELRLLLAVFAVAYVSVLLTIYIGQPHYLAHLTTLFYLLLLLMMRDLHSATGFQPALKILARGVPMICFLLLLLRIAAPVLHHSPKPSWTRTWCSQDEQNLERARILGQLEHTPGDHLVIVRYRPDHDFILDEWVYNRADIDGSKVIWARDMGVQNAELFRYFPARQAWLVEPDVHPAKLSLYAE